MQQIIGNPKQFIVVEREVITKLIELANELEVEKGIHTQGKGLGIKYAVEVIKENNIYNKEFEFKG